MTCSQQNTGDKVRSPYKGLADLPALMKEKDKQSIVTVELPVPLRTREKNTWQETGI